MRIIKPMKLNTDLILKLMKMEGIGIYGLAKDIKMSPRNLYYIILKGTTTFKTLDKIAERLDVNPKDLLI